MIAQFKFYHHSRPIIPQFRQNVNLGYRFTDEDNKAIVRACRDAVAFMRNYGRVSHRPKISLSENIINPKHTDPF